MAAIMGLEFLARVRRSSIVAGLVVTLAVAAAAPYALAGGFAAGVAWSLVNLALLQFVVVTMTIVSARTVSSRSPHAVWIEAVCSGP